MFSKGRTASRKCSMNRMEGDIVDCIHQSLIFGVGGCITAMALERKVTPSGVYEFKKKTESH